MGRKKNLGEEINPEIQRLYVECGKSLNQISKTLSIHPEIIKRRLRKMGITTRNLSESMSNFFRPQVIKNTEVIEAKEDNNA